MNLDPASFVEWNVLFLGDYEGEEKRIFCDLARRRGKTDVCLDVGANVGLHSLTFAETFRSVVSLDPNPLVFERLERNIETGSARNITALNIGLADRDGTLIFYQPTDARQGMGTFDADSAPANAREIALPIRIGDEVVDEQGLGDRVDAIKIDVQGFEPQVLTGLRATLERCWPLLWFEVSESTIERFTDYGGIKGTVPYDFDLYRFDTRAIGGLIHRMRLLRCDVDDPLTGADYVVVPKA
ncbi:FkbM family methyltransferase [Sphingopyxis sp. PET50]|uniref:FkbM family methyltransferase n=1 Tax=Sphingopyxis sp. PET50 TaxID=2976533 RepID=UPI0021B053CD|nr:FkbM family methyltransferase [Sphingopyxis sp. PET50]